MKIDSQKGFIIPLILVVAALIVAGGVGYMVWRGKTNSNATSVIMADDSAAASANSTSTWKTYQGNSFSIDYPTGFIAVSQNFSDATHQEKIITFTPPVPISFGDKLGINIITKTVGTLSSFVASFAHNGAVITDNALQVNGMEAAKVSINDCNEDICSYITHIVFQNEGIIYDLVGSGQDFYSGSEFTEFYDSFRFTSSSTNSTSTQSLNANSSNPNMIGLTNDQSGCQFGSPSNSTTSLPMIIQVLPSVVSIGQTITIEGKNFDPAPGMTGSDCAHVTHTSVILGNLDNNTWGTLWVGNEPDKSTTITSGSITVTIPSQICMTFGACPSSYAYEPVIPGRYSIRVSVDGRGDGNDSIINISN